MANKNLKHKDAEVKSLQEKVQKYQELLNQYANLNTGGAPLTLQNQFAYGYVKQELQLEKEKKSENDMKKDLMDDVMMDYEEDEELENVD